MNTVNKKIKGIVASLIILLTTMLALAQVKESANDNPKTELKSNGRYKTIVDSVKKSLTDINYKARFEKGSKQIVATGSKTGYEKLSNNQQELLIQKLKKYLNGDDVNKMIDTEIEIFVNSKIDEQVEENKKNELKKNEEYKSFILRYFETKGLDVETIISVLSNNKTETDKIIKNFNINNDTAAALVEIKKILSSQYENLKPKEKQINKWLGKWSDKDGNYTLFFMSDNQVQIVKNKCIKDKTDTAKYDPNLTSQNLKVSDLKNFVVELNEAKNEISLKELNSKNTSNVLSKVK